MHAPLAFYSIYDATLSFRRQTRAHILPAVSQVDFYLMINCTPLSKSVQISTLFFGFSIDVPYFPEWVVS